MRSWFQAAPKMSLRMLDAAGVTAADSVIDVGGGASPLAGALLGRGFQDVTVLDVSAAAMEYARRRLGPRARQVHWLTADIRAWRPVRCFAAWHDRAVFHFLTTEPGRQDYRRALGRPPPRAPSPSSAASPRVARCSAPACRWPATRPATSPPNSARLELVAEDRETLTSDA